MKRGLSCCLFAVAFGAILRPAAAQEVATPTNAVVVADSTVAARPVPSATQLQPALFSLSERVTVGVSPAIHTSFDAQAQAADGGIKGFFFGSQRRTSNTLMIGGVVVAGIGVGVVKGEVGAILGVLGILSSVGGLYLAF